MMENLTVSREVKKRWQHLSRRLLQLAKVVFIHLRQATRLGMMPEHLYQNYLEDKEPQKPKPPTAAEMHQMRLQQTCTHQEFRRYGNGRGSFAMCIRCKARWRWEETGWKLHGSSCKSSLPLPSSSTTLDGSIPPPSFEAAHLPLQGSQPKSKSTPRLTQGYLPTSTTGRTRSRAPSMTSSAAGHMLRDENQMQECDFEMPEEETWSLGNESD